MKSPTEGFICGPNCDGACCKVRHSTLFLTAFLAFFAGAAVVAALAPVLAKLLYE